MPHNLTILFCTAHHVLEMLVNYILYCESLLLSKIHVCHQFIFIPCAYNYNYVDETLEQANCRRNSVVNDYKLTISQLKKEIGQLRAENDVLRSSLPVKLEPIEPTDPLSSFKEEPEPCELLSPFQVLSLFECVLLKIHFSLCVYNSTASE